MLHTFFFFSQLRVALFQYSGILNCSEDRFEVMVTNKPELGNEIEMILSSFSFPKLIIINSASAGV